MKKTILVLMAVLICGPCLVYAQQRSWTIQPAPDVSRPVGEPGSMSNPYRVTERPDGSLEMRSTYQDVRRPIGETGSPSNPYRATPDNNYFQPTWRPIR